MMDTTSPASRILVPREHGTYGELLFPMLSVMAIGQPGRAAWGLAVLALGGFLAHEGLAVLAGTRGVRARRSHRRAAWGSLATFGGLAMIGAAWAWPSLTRETLLMTGVAAMLSVAAVALAWFGREHTLAGELMAVVTLSGWCAPVGLSGGLTPAVAGAIWVTWAGVFAMATCAVHVVVARTSRRPIAPVRGLGLIFGAATAVALGAFVNAGVMPAHAHLTLIPGVVAFFVLTAAPIRATSLRAVGWSVVGVSLLTLALMVLVLA